mmetsp:Transcript_23060/g.30116  ORF Transcript_23060/g.30116 Transcript_23060/m.30116 type:complete len:228 (-) Transcript_23060:234-917(-)
MRAPELLQAIKSTASWLGAGCRSSLLGTSERVTAHGVLPFSMHRNTVTSRLADAAAARYLPSREKARHVILFACPGLNFLILFPDFVSIIFIPVPATANELPDGCKEIIDAPCFNPFIFLVSSPLSKFHSQIEFSLELEYTLVPSELKDTDEINDPSPCLSEVAPNLEVTTPLCKSQTVIVPEFVPTASLPSPPLLPELFRFRETFVAGRYQSKHVYFVDKWPFSTY